jgi:two-component system, cell cycle response regulator DivK
MPRILVVDSDPAMRRLTSAHLRDSWEVIDSGSAEDGLKLALECKPDVILLDLMMPQFSGFELCHAIHSLSCTSNIPIFAMAGPSVGKLPQHCAQIGARGYFEKPLDFDEVQKVIRRELKKKGPERRMHLRVRMQVLLKLIGSAPDGDSWQEIVTTENISAGGFLCPCMNSLTKLSAVDVFLAGGVDVFVGPARVVRKESSGRSWHKYGFQFVGEARDWILQ